MWSSTENSTDRKNRASAALRQRKPDLHRLGVGGRVPPCGARKTGRAYAFPPCRNAAIPPVAAGPRQPPLGKGAMRGTGEAVFLSFVRPKERNQRKRRLGGEDFGLLPLLRTFLIETTKRGLRAPRWITQGKAGDGGRGRKRSDLGIAPYEGETRERRDVEGRRFVNRPYGGGRGTRDGGARSAGIDRREKNIYNTGDNNRGSRGTDPENRIVKQHRESRRRTGEAGMRNSTGKAGEGPGEPGCETAPGKPGKDRGSRDVKQYRGSRGNNLGSRDAKQYRGSRGNNLGSRD